jgi:nitrogen fixation protein FixH
MVREIKGWHVLTGFVMAFAVILAVNLVLAVNAVHTFPGLEVKNSYVASQTFDRDRAAQLGLAWSVSATLDGNELRLQILKDKLPIAPTIESAIFGRATSVVADQAPDFEFDGMAYRATVQGGPGNWNLRLKARGEDGSLFQQRIIVRVQK